ncbi:MAG: lipid II flippase MurJ [Pseudomonadota bacterium]
MTVSLLLLLGRLSGFLREWLIAVYGGATKETDIAIVLVSLPDLMVNLLMGGGFAAAIVPMLKKRTIGDANRLFLKLVLIVTIVFCTMTLIIVAMPGMVMLLMIPGASTDDLAAATPYFIMAALAVPLTAVSGVLQAKLVSAERFLISQAGTLIFNATIIASILVAANYGIAFSIAVGILAGATIRLTAQVIQLLQIWKPPTSNKIMFERGFFSSLLVTTLFSATLALIPVAGRAYASWVEPGALSLFNYAFRISELPVALFFASLTIVLLPRISAAFLNQDHERILEEVALVLRFSLLVGFAIAILIFFFSRELVYLLFSRTQISPAQLEELAVLLLIAIIFMPFRGCLILCLSMLSATGNERSLIPIAISALITLVVICTLFVPQIGIAGAMLGYGVAHFVGFIVFMVALQRHIDKAVLPLVLMQFLRFGAVPLSFMLITSWGGSQLALDGLPIVVFCVLALAAFSAAVICVDADARSIFMKIFARAKGT